MKKLIVFLNKCLLTAAGPANKLFNSKGRQLPQDDTLFI
ncbi:MAG: hypothetical protein JWP78_1445 [Mucilaginibacter sp.]|nr:hypothetical protein [Mucilaginibacter sp.]